MGYSHVVVRICKYLLLIGPGNSSQVTLRPYRTVIAPVVPRHRVSFGRFSVGNSISGFSRAKGHSSNDCRLLVNPVA